MKQILLTHGYFIKADPKEQAIMRPYPPLGMLYVSAYLEAHGWENEIFDTTFSTPEALQQSLLTSPPDYLLCYVNLMTRPRILDLIRFVKGKASLKHTKVILGGPEVRYHAENLLRHGADFLVIGEGEQSALELIQHLTSSHDSQPTQVEGLAFFDEKERVVYTPERKKIRNLDTLPLPNRNKINLQQYLDTWQQYHGKSTISVSTMRGCPYTCRWCSRAVYGLSYRRRSPEKVVAELLALKHAYQPDSIWFVDDVFTVSHKWLGAFASAVQQADAIIPFECITRADRMNEAVIDTLKAAGCFRVWIGAESGSQAIIDKMDRRVKVEQVQAMIQLARAKGLEAGTFIMLGYPGETETDIENTIQHLKRSNPDHFTITLTYPIKGTELYAEVMEHTRPNIDWQTQTDRDIDFPRTYSRPYYHWAIRRVVNEVNFYKLSQAKRSYTLRAARYKTQSLAAKMGMWWYRTLY